MSNKVYPVLAPVPSADTPPPPRVDRFEIFKGEFDGGGRLRRLRSVGQARLSEGQRTYQLQLKTLLSDTFYLLPERTGPADFAILTREPSTVPGRKWFWNKVGEATILPPPNETTLHLCFDLFRSDGIYMSLVPAEREPQDVRPSA